LFPWTFAIGGTFAIGAFFLLLPPWYLSAERRRWQRGETRAGLRRSGAYPVCGYAKWRNAGGCHGGEVVDRMPGRRCLRIAVGVFIMTTYTVVLDAKGDFGVELQMADGQREVVGGFKTEDEATRWLIARQRSDGSDREPD
jgi:hypothetical protein